MKRRASISWRKTSTSTPLRAQPPQTSFAEEVERESNRNLDILAAFFRQRAEKNYRKNQLEATNALKYLASCATILQSDTLQMCKERDTLQAKLDRLTQYEEEAKAIDELTAVAKSQLETISQISTSDGIRIKKQPHEKAETVLKIVEKLKESLSNPEDLVKVTEFAQATDSVLQVVQLQGEMKTVVKENLAKMRELEALEREFLTNQQVIENLPDVRVNSIKSMK